MKAIRGLSVKNHKDGLAHFYWNGHDVTGHWMWFFSGLNLKEERYCSWIYARRHGKELNRLYPMPPKPPSKLINRVRGR